ncbi:MAG: VTT domain-containing protein [Desulfobacterota bacterium]|jgi:uncharacterized membrane protein YdjX (TVP38/TMEM64 family)|nr:VTT domain-containing protein [Thermodesulfobacteriota bacterium]
MKKTIGISAAFLVLFVLILYVLIYHSDLYLFFLDRKRLAEFIKSFGAVAPLIFISVQIFQVLFAPIPGEVTGFLGGFLFGNFFGLLYSTIGLGLGSWLAFVFSRWVGRPVVERIIKPSLIDRFDYLMAHKGAFIAFLLFLIPGFPKDYLCYILGLGHMGLKEFLVISTVGRFLGTALLTWQGHLARERNYLVLGIVIGVSLLVVLLVLLLRPRIEAYIRRQHRQPPPPRD